MAHLEEDCDVASTVFRELGDVEMLSQIKTSEKVIDLPGDDRYDYEFSNNLSTEDIAQGYSESGLFGVSALNNFINYDEPVAVSSRVAYPKETFMEETSPEKSKKDESNNLLMLALAAAKHTGSKSTDTLSVKSDGAIETETELDTMLEKNIPQFRLVELPISQTLQKCLNTVKIDDHHCSGDDIKKRTADLSNQWKMVYNNLHDLMTRVRRIQMYHAGNMISKELGYAARMVKKTTDENKKIVPEVMTKQESLAKSKEDIQKMSTTDLKNLVKKIESKGKNDRPKEKELDVLLLPPDITRQLKKLAPKLNEPLKELDKDYDSEATLSSSDSECETEIVKMSRNWQMANRKAQYTATDSIKTLEEGEDADEKLDIEMKKLDGTRPSASNGKHGPYKHDRTNHPAYKWLEQRAFIASRWTWLTIQIQDLECKVRSISELYRHFREQKESIQVGNCKIKQTKIDLINTISSPELSSLTYPYRRTVITSDVGKTTELTHQSFLPPVDETQSDNYENLTEEETCAAVRCLPFNRLCQNRRLIRIPLICRKLKRQIKPTLIKCRCVRGESMCAVCCDQDNYVKQRDIDCLSLREQIALFDPTFHPQLSFPSDVSNDIIAENTLKSEQWATFLKTKLVDPRNSISKIPITKDSEGKPVYKKKYKKKSDVPTVKRISVKAEKFDSHMNAANKNINIPLSEGLSKRLKGTKTETNKQNFHRIKKMKHAAKIARAAMKRNQVGTILKIKHRERIAFGKRVSLNNKNQETKRKQVKCVVKKSVIATKMDILNKRKKESYDIDNIVIPYSIAAATRVETLEYKEIPVPSFRVLDINPKNRLDGEKQEDEMDDEGYVVLHKRCLDTERTQSDSKCSTIKPTGRRKRVDSLADSIGSCTSPASFEDDEVPGSSSKQPPQKKRALSKRSRTTGKYSGSQSHPAASSENQTDNPNVPAANRVTRAMVYKVLGLKKSILEKRCNTEVAVLKLDDKSVEAAKKDVDLVEVDEPNDSTTTSELPKEGDDDELYAYLGEEYKGELYGSREFPMDELQYIQMLAEMPEDYGTTSTKEEKKVPSFVMTLPSESSEEEIPDDPKDREWQPRKRKNEEQL